MTERYEQPELTDDWGVPFYGRAETTTGHVWWYEQNGKRYLLRPAGSVAHGEEQPR